MSKKCCFGDNLKIMSARKIRSYFMLWDNFGNGHVDFESGAAANNMTPVFWQLRKAKKAGRESQSLIMSIE